MPGRNHASLVPRPSGEAQPWSTQPRRLAISRTAVLRPRPASSKEEAA